MLATGLVLISMREVSEKLVTRCQNYVQMRSRKSRLSTSRKTRVLASKALPEWLPTLGSPRGVPCENSFQNQGPQVISQAPRPACRLLHSRTLPLSTISIPKSLNSDFPASDVSLRRLSKATGSLV
eukprot:jgi/Botrbrau1/12519/Bobra.0169s0061.1